MDGRINNTYLRIEKTHRKNYIVEILEYMFVFLIILEFNTAYMYFPVVGSILTNAPILTLLLLVAFKSNSLKFNYLIILYLIGSVIPLFNVFKGEEFTYIKLYMLFVPITAMYCFCLNEEKRPYSLLLKFSNIVVIEASISIFFWIFGTNLGMISPTMYVPNNWGFLNRLIPSYYNIYFETQEVALGIRNSGIFNEGPMHNMILCIALSIECFMREKIRYVIVCIFVVAILSTQTTTGILFLAILPIVLYIFLKRKKINFFSIVLAPFLIVLFLNFSTYIIDDKREYEGGNISVESRSYDIERCIEVGMENPILGVGLFRKSLERSYVRSKSQYGGSNSIFKAFAHGGAYTFTLYVVLFLFVPLYYYIRKQKNNWPPVVLLFFIVFAITSSLYKILTFFFLGFVISKIMKTKTI